MILSLLSPLALALASGTLAEPEPQQSIAPNLADPDTEILRLDEDRNDRMTVPVSIDGSGPFRFMIDTGSQATAVTDKVLGEVGLAPAGSATLVGMAASRLVPLVTVNTLDLGSRKIHDFDAPVLERAHVGADGILGLDSLQDLRVLIDFREETIALADAHDRLSSRGYEIVVRARPRHGQLLITNALVDGVRATVIVDTGGQGSIGNLALRDRIRQRRAEQVTATDVHGATIEGQLAFAEAVVIDDMTLNRVPITYADTPAFEALGLSDRPVLALGMQHLRMFDRIAIDFAKRKILFDLPSKIRLQRKMRKARASRL